MPDGVSAKEDGVLLGLRNIYIFPTGNGWTFIIAMFLLLLCAINYSNNLLHGLVFFFGGLFLVCLQHTYRSLWGLRLAPGPPPDSAFAGADLTFSIVVRNSRPEQRHGVTVEMRCDSFAGGKAGSGPRSISGDGSTTINVAAPTTRRGWLSPEKVRISSVYPLGLFRAWSNPPFNERVLVYPRAAGNKPLPQAAIDQQDEPEQGARTLGHDEYEGLKPYYPGAPLRDIHWKKSLQDDIFVHDFSGYDSRIWMLELGQVASIEDEEERISQLCMWIMILRDKRQPYGLALPGARVKPGVGPAHDAKCLAALAVL